MVNLNFDCKPDCKLDYFIVDFAIDFATNFNIDFNPFFYDLVAYTKDVCATNSDVFR